MQPESKAVLFIVKFCPRRQTGRTYDLVLVRLKGLGDGEATVDSEEGEALEYIKGGKAWERESLAEVAPRLQASDFPVSVPSTPSLVKWTKDFLFSSSPRAISGLPGVPVRAPSSGILC